MNTKYGFVIVFGNHVKYRLAFGTSAAESIDGLWRNSFILVTSPLGDSSRRVSSSRVVGVGEYSPSSIIQGGLLILGDFYNRVVVSFQKIGGKLGALPT